MIHLEETLKQVVDSTKTCSLAEDCPYYKGSCNHYVEKTCQTKKFLEKYGVNWRELYIGSKL